MVSNQEVTKSSSSLARLIGGLAALTLAGGCQSLSNGKAAEAPQTPVAHATMPVTAAPDNAIDAALARGDSPDAAAAPAPATPAMNPNAPLSYTVKRGDTLWDISAMYLRDPWLWPEIWHVNPSVQNPHLIYPGDVLTLAYGANGEPQVSIARGNAVRVQPLVRSTTLDGPIASIPYEAIAAFLGKPSIVSKEDMRSAPRVAALRDRHVLGGAGYEFYVKGLEQQGPGRYLVVHVGDALKDPETGKVLGYMGTYTGTARVDNATVDSSTNVSRAMLIESARETMAGDLLFAEDLHSVSTDFAPRAPPAGVDGQIMAVVDGVALIGQYQVIAINRGTRHGLATGHVLAIDQNSETIPDASCRRSSVSWCLGKNVNLPHERTGTLLVFKTYQQMSYGLVVNATVPIRVKDRVRTP
jgi:LysM repeat protein